MNILRKGFIILSAFCTMTSLGGWTGNIKDHEQIDTSKANTLHKDTGTSEINNDLVVDDVIEMSTYNEDDICTIIFSNDKQLYKGFIDKSGKLLLYAPFYQEDLTEKHSGKDKADFDFSSISDGSYYFENEGKIYTLSKNTLRDEMADIENAGFENGYSWFDYEDERYIIDEDGKICSFYPISEVAYTYAGYTWKKEVTEADWQNDEVITYELYGPTGEEVTEFELEKGSSISFLYLGNLIFDCEMSNSKGKYYFVDSNQWMDYDSSFGSNIAKDFNAFDNDYILIRRENNSLSFFTETGEIIKKEVPDECCYGIKQPSVKAFKGHSVLLGLNGSSTQPSYAILDVDDGSIKKYEGEYVGYISGNSALGESCFVFGILGKDNKHYIGSVDKDTMEELCDPISVEGYEWSLFDDFIVLKDKESNVQILDSEGNQIYEFDGCDEIKISNGKICLLGDDYSPMSCYSSSKSIFTKLNTSKAKNILDNISTSKK